MGSGQSEQKQKAEVPTRKMPMQKLKENRYLKIHARSIVENKRMEDASFNDFKFQVLEVEKARFHVLGDLKRKRKL